MQVLVGSVVMIVLLILFEVFGVITSFLLKRKSGFIENLIMGFFAYYSFFQILALPMVLLKQSLSDLAKIWGICLVVVILFFIYVVIKQRESTNSWKKYVKTFNVYTLLLVLCILALCIVSLMQDYYGWDTAYYIGNINTSLYTDTMYLVDGNSGALLEKIDFRYALSMFYMNSAVFCKWFGITAVCMQKYVIAILCILMHASIVYMIGKELFGDDLKKSALFVTIALGLNFFFVSEYTSSQFLLLRGYEAKGYCANVVITALLWLILRLWKGKDDTFKYIFLVMFASIPVSMSSILIVPVLLVIGVLVEIIIQKKLVWIKQTIICLVPNIIYLVVYFLYTQNILVIKV